MTAPSNHPSRQVDVVLPVYNDPRYLEEAVRSAVQQTVPPARILIADDGSTDRTSELAVRLAQTYPGVEHLRLPHGGVSAARNAGILASNAPYVAFLDADDVWYPTKLERQFDVFAQAGERLGLVYSAYQAIDVDGALAPGVYVQHPTMRGDVFRPLLLEHAVGGAWASIALIRRRVLDEVGLFDPVLYFGEDRDLWLRIAHVSQVDYSPEVLVGIRENPDSVQRRMSSSKRLGFFRQRMIILGKWMKELENEEEYLATMRGQAIYILQQEIEDFYFGMKADGSPVVDHIFEDFTDVAVGLLTRFRIQAA